MVPLSALTDALQSLPVVVAAGLLALDLALRIALLGIIPHNRKPSSAMAWLLLILLIPFLGLASSWCWAGPRSGGAGTSSRPRSTRSWRTAHADPTLEADLPRARVRRVGGAR